jgi:hypothetical protein
MFAARRGSRVEDGEAKVRMFGILALSCVKTHSQARQGAPNKVKQTTMTGKKGKKRKEKKKGKKITAD